MDQPQIDDLNARLVAEQNSARRAQFEDLSKDELATRLANPQFAQAYAQAMQVPQDDTEVREMRASLVNILEVGREQGLSQERIDQYAADIQSGKYNGVHWTTAIGDIQADIYRELKTVPESTPAAPSPETPIPANDAPVELASPDVSGNTSRGTAGKRLTVADMRQMTPQQLMKIPQEQRDRALTEG